jgi:hypothetical protein
MATARSLGRVFVTLTNQAQGAPMFDRCFTRETEGAMRSGEGWCIRPPFTRHRPVRALVVGVWRKPSQGPGVGPEQGS